MSLSMMKYKNYTFMHNPSKINVTVVRNIKEIGIPFNGSIFQDYGRQKRIVSGSGNFLGDNCIEQFNELFNIFKMGGTGYLTIPSMEPFLAVFKSLELEGSIYPNMITYSFEFWEDMGILSDNTLEKGSYHVVKSGDTLWSIALKYGLKNEDLIELNSNIKNPNFLTVNQKVILK